MNSAIDDEEPDEEEDVFGVAERLRKIREGTYKTEQDEELSSDEENEGPFKRPK